MCFISPTLHPLVLFNVLFSFATTAAIFAAAAASAQYINGRLQFLVLTAGTAGPESIAFDRFGEGPYTGVSDGRILKWQSNGKGWQSFAFPSQWSERNCHVDEVHLETVCGRPLGLQFNGKTGELYIADAYFGLMVVRPEGGWAITVASEADGIPFAFTNGVDVDQESGVVYFTDSSTSFQRWDHDLVVATDDSTGRFMKYDPATNQVTVLLSGLKFPNGVSVSQDRTYVLITSTSDCLVWRYWLQGPEAGEVETFAELTGYPDNIKRNPAGDFWVAISTERIQIGGGEGKVSAVRLSEEGRVLEVLDRAVMSPLSEVLERNGTLWLGSVDLPCVGVYNK